MTEMIVAAFDSASAAEAAVQDLERAKIPSVVVRSYTKEDPDYTGFRARETQHKGGFWAWLLGEEPSYTSEYDAYDTSLASGHTVVTVTVDEIHADAAVGVLNQHGPREVHEHEHEGGVAGADQTAYQNPAVAGHVAGKSAVAQDYGSAGLTDRADYVAPGVSSSEVGARKGERQPVRKKRSSRLLRRSCRSANAPLIAARLRSDAMWFASRSKSRSRFATKR